jgi:ribonuclease D
MDLIDPLASAGPLAELVAEMAAAPAVGLDTEFLRERTYRAQLCLLQLATPGRCVSVDPLAPGFELEPLRPVLAAGPVKLMHAARQDLEVLWPLFGPLAPVYDTQVAASLAGLPAQVGYGELVRQLLGVDLAKGQTRTDWSRRPLSPDQLHYALDDVRYLAGLRDALDERLDRLGRRGWLVEELQDLGDPAQLFVDPERAAERLKWYGELDPDRQRLAQALAAWRERRAADRNRPRTWILDDAGLRSLVLRAPRDLAAMGLLELPPGFVERSGPELLQVIESAGVPARLPPPSGRSRPDPAIATAVKTLGDVTRAVATELNVGPEILATRRELERLVRGDRDIGPLRGWRRDVIGAALLEAAARA